MTKPASPELALETLVLGRARAGLVPSSRQRQLTLERLAASLVAAGPLPVVEAGAHSARFSLQALITGVVGAALVGFVVGAFSPWRVTAPRPALPPTNQPSKAVEVSSTAVAALPAVSTNAPEHGPALKPLHAKAKSELTQHVAAPSASSIPTLYEELSAVRRAQSALKHGEATLALGLMRELDESHPAGALLAERSVTKVLALCHLGRRAEASAIASALLRDRPDAEVYRRRLATSCASTTISPSEQ